MFDIGFSELLLIAVLTLLLVGPERLPGVVKTIARTLSRIKHNWNSVRRELEKEIGMDEIRRDIHNEQVMRDLSKMNQRFTMDSLTRDPHDDETSTPSIAPPAQPSSTDPVAGDSAPESSKLSDSTSTK